jgi:hypothetical protein
VCTLHAIEQLQNNAGAQAQVQDITRNLKNSNAVIFISHDHHDSHSIGQWRRAFSGPESQPASASLLLRRSPPPTCFIFHPLRSASSAVN